MDELHGRLPPIRGVTLLTLRPDLVPVYVSMTPFAIARESQIRFGRHQGFVVLYIPRRDVLTGVALRAVFFPMFSLEAKTRLVVIE